MNTIKYCIYRFRLFIKNLFRRKNEKKVAIDYDATFEEKWICNSFAPPFSNVRFAEEQGDGYSAFFQKEHSSFALELKRKNLYAWIQNKFYRYKDFVLEAKIRIVKNTGTIQKQTIGQDENMAGSSAVGWIFRNIEKAFYSVLISDAGFFRIDLVINNTPKTLIPWTKLIEEIGDEFKITIVSFNSFITCLVNDCWVVNVKDDTIDASGKIAFAGQNYNQNSNIKFLLKSISINSYLVDVQKKYDELNNEQNIKKEARRRLANSYYTIGNIVASVDEIKNIEKLGLEAEDALLGGKIYFSARLIDEAEKYFLKAIESKSTHKEALEQLLNLYYYSDNYKSIKNTLDSLKQDEIENSSTLCNIKAHYLHYIGQHNEAANFYNKAFNLSPEQGLFAFNAGREYESAGNIDNAIFSYMEASNIFLKTKQYVDMGQVLNALEHLAKYDERYLIISAKFYYAIEKYDEASRYLKILTDNNSNNADVWYLYALILQMKKDKKAKYSFEKAYRLKPNESLYCFRYAEALFLEKEDCEDYVKEAIRLDEKNGWAYNLYATLMLDKNEINKALVYIIKAREYLPSEITILGNYIHIKRINGELDECYSLFGCVNSELEGNSVEDAKISSSLTMDIAVEQNLGEACYLFANELHQENRLEEGHNWYEKAIKLIPNNSALLLDAAINSNMLGYLNEAENYAMKAHDISSSLKTYRLISMIAKEMGDYARSEVSLMQALNEYGRNEELLFDLAHLFFTINKKEKSLCILKELETLPNHDAIVKSDRFIQLEKLLKN